MFDEYIYIYIYIYIYKEKRILYFDEQFEKSAKWEPELARNKLVLEIPGNVWDVEVSAGWWNDCVDDWHLAKLLPTSKHGGLNITIMPNGWLIQGLIGD